MPRPSTPSLLKVLGLGVYTDKGRNLVFVREGRMANGIVTLKDVIIGAFSTAQVEIFKAMKLPPGLNSLAVANEMNYLVDSRTPRERRLVYGYNLRTQLGRPSIPAAELTQYTL
jgi:hypothetical protein